MNPNYLIVVQWKVEDGNFDFLIEIENHLRNELSGYHEVDGHDMGCGEVNIFIISSDPKLAFLEIRNALKGKLSMNDVRIAYRDLEGEDYIVLWPEGLSDFSVA